MKKIKQLCKICGIETTHRQKATSEWLNKDKGRIRVVLPLKCMTCGYEEGKKTKTTNKKHTLTWT